ncbi:SAM domain and HD [Bulinus truncatus]|nr:SAM domain and HD [Bulinus truncatus]
MSSQTTQWDCITVNTFIEGLERKEAPTELIEFVKQKCCEVQTQTTLRHILISLSADEMMKNGVKSYGDCLVLFNYLDELQETPLMELKCKSPKVLKIFNDPVHGHIQLHPACQMIVDTPQFQRLRDIKQLGAVYFVYPGAAHNRFEHSLGACHLAGLFAKALSESQPRLGITAVDILCVEIAGLCRNLGQGPFSRVYVNLFLPAIKGKIKYRKQSAQMFEHLLVENDLKKKLKAYGIGENDITFIKEQIEGSKPTGSTAWPYEGRTQDKSYLYEIVVNRRNGIDVCKWDYLARDCLQLGIQNNFDASRYMKFARVIEVDGEVQICIRDKEISNLYSMFYTRYTVNKYAYSHKVTLGIELMIVDALKEANEIIRFKGKNEELSIYDSHRDMVAFTKLTDFVLSLIRNKSVDELSDEQRDSLRRAQEIIRRIFQRDLYTCVYETSPMAPKNLQASDKSEPTEKDIQLMIFKRLGEKQSELNSIEVTQKIQMIKETDIIVKIVNLDFGMKEENPVERLKVYRKSDLNSAQHLRKEEASRILGPVNFNEILVRVYSKDKDVDKCRWIHQAAKDVIKVKEMENRQT